MERGEPKSPLVIGATGVFRQKSLQKVVRFRVFITDLEFVYARTTCDERCFRTI